MSAVVIESEPDVIAIPKTLLVFDNRMVGHAMLNNPSANHPESPARFQEPLKKLQEYDLLKKCRVVSKLKPATRSNILLVHTERLLNQLEQSEKMSPEELQSLCAQSANDDLFFTKETSECAKISCAAVIKATQRVVLGKSANAFALVRPPGHHAEPDRSMGYCHINNVAVAVQVMLHKKQIKRCLIVDWDVHHGNGTQQHFWNDPNVLYFSIHRHDMGGFYPYKSDADFDQVGGPAALGKTVNVPWPSGSFDDDDYLEVFDKLLLPIAYEFKPDIVVVSCGFDAGVNDAGGCLVTPTGFAQMTRQLMDPKLANGKLVLALEGGIELKHMSECVAACVRALLQEKIKKKGRIQVSKDAMSTIEKVMTVQRRHWKCIEEKATRMNLDTIISVTEQLSKHESLSFDALDAFHFSRRCRWISDFGLLTLDTAGCSGYEILASPNFQDESDVVHIFLLDRPFAMFNQTRIVCGAVPYIDKLFMEYSRFVILEFNSEFIGEELDKVEIKLWEIIETKLASAKKIAIISSGSKATKLTAILLEHANRISPGHKIRCVTMFGYGYIPNVQTAPSINLRQPNIYVLCGGSDLKESIVADRQRANLGEVFCFDEHATSLAQLMINKFEEVFTFESVD
ncbi:hypothetical protein BDR26DRAFT_849907 [Obelidium mucronatum]|nr:hypothetical protein BDR26DRAFT_849907 [Obelidium mucronatum]